MIRADVAALLLEKADHYNRPAFIEQDPLSIPRRFTKKQDIELIGFWTAMLAWGGRSVILRKASELVAMMDGAPHDFVRGHTAKDKKRFAAFKHRTFNAEDALYFLNFFQAYYAKHDSLEDAFCADGGKPWGKSTLSIEPALVKFAGHFESYPGFPERTRKHVSSPSRASACKRLCMYLRWMVRSDNRGVDFGLWKRIKPRQLVMPMDVHVVRVSKALGLMGDAAVNWNAALALTNTLKELDANDPVRFDYALFGLGVEGKM